MIRIRDIEKVALDMMRRSENVEIKGMLSHIALLCYSVERRYNERKKHNESETSEPVYERGWIAGENDVDEACAGKG
mgnify:FL=1